MATSLKVSNIKCTSLPNLEGKDESSKKKTDPYVIIKYLGKSILETHYYSVEKFAKPEVYSNT